AGDFIVGGKEEGPGRADQKRLLRVKAKHGVTQNRRKERSTLAEEDSVCRPAVQSIMAERKRARQTGRVEPGRKSLKIRARPRGAEPASATINWTVPPRRGRTAIAPPEPAPGH